MTVVLAFPCQTLVLHTPKNMPVFPHTLQTPPLRCIVWHCFIESEKQTFLESSDMYLLIIPFKITITFHKHVFIFGQHVAHTLVLNPRSAIPREFVRLRLQIQDLQREITRLTARIEAVATQRLARQKPRVITYSFRRSCFRLFLCLHFGCPFWDPKLTLGGQKCEKVTPNDTPQ